MEMRKINFLLQEIKFVQKSAGPKNTEMFWKESRFDSKLRNKTDLVPFRLLDP